MDLESHWYTAPETPLARHLQHPGIPVYPCGLTQRTLGENISHGTSPSTITNFSLPVSKNSYKTVAREKDKN